MNARSKDSDEPTTPQTQRRRRGLIASLAALALGMLAKSATSVEAQSNPSLQLNQTNSSTGSTELNYNGQPGSNATLVVRNPSFDGIQSWSYPVFVDRSWLEPVR